MAVVCKIHLPMPHEKQLAIRQSTAKRQILCAGRRGGKTTLAALVAIEKALAGRRVLLASPTQEQADAFWDKCKTWLADAIDTGHVYKNESRRLLTFPNGGRVRAKTAWNADTLRGDYADFLVLDEFAMMEPSAWEQVGAPMLLDNDGDAWFISTPKRKNHFYALYIKGLEQEQDGGRWQSWHFTSFDNPHLSQAALAEISGDMSEDDVQQEIMAEFLENSGAVFRNIGACLNAPVTTPLQHAGHQIVVGVDWGKAEDYTCMSVGCATCKTELELHRSRGIEYRIQRQRLADMVGKWDAQAILPERNSIGEPIIEELLNAGLPIMAGPDNKPGYQTTPSSKPPLIEATRLAFEHTEWQWLPDRVARAELEAFEVNVSPKTGRPDYSAPTGVHDDSVIARCLTVHAGAWVGMEYVRVIA